MNKKTNYGVIMEKNKKIKQPKSDPLWQKVIIFYQRKKFKEKFTYISNRLFARSIYSSQNLELFYLQLNNSTYPLIYIDIDSIFFRLNEILTYIGETINKKANIYPITTNVENFYSLKKRDFLENVMPLLWMGEEIIDTKDEEYPYFNH